jgi:hypothetical protein
MRARVSGLLGSAVLAGALLVGSAAVAPAAQASDVPAVLAGWDAQDLAPGLRLYSGVVGKTSPAQHWTVTVQVSNDTGPNPDPDAPVADLGAADAAAELADGVRAAGFAPLVEQVRWPDYADTPHGTLGWRVRVGSYPDQATAQSTVDALVAAGLKAHTDWTGFDGTAIPGPWRIRVAVVDPRYRGSVVASHGDTVSGRRTTSAQSAAAGALVGVNAGFFVIDPADGVPGTPAGIGVYQGELDREATNGRVDLVLGDHPAIEGLTTKITVRAGAAKRAVNGLNRKPGLIRDCGEPGDQPTDKPRHDTTCTNPDELVLITPALGGPAPDGPGVEAVLDGHDRVTALRPRGGAVPAGGSVLQGIGGGAAWLSAHAHPGARLTVDERVTDDRGHPVRFDHSDSVVGGGPWLVRDGRVWINAAADGLVHPDDPAWIYGWALKRNPRTMVGIDAHGRLLVVTVDGRQAGFSEGFSITEAAAFMHSLGAVDAMNLDGGGSTAMAVHGKLVTSPSDATGERPVGDTVLVLPPGPGH